MVNGIKPKPVSNRNPGLDHFHGRRRSRLLHDKRAASRILEWLAMQCLEGMKNMAKKSKLRDAAIKIGSTIGKLDGTAHKAARDAARAAHVAKQEFVELTKQMKALRKQLRKSTKRLKRAFK
jgi:hypothetical protein